MAKLWGNIEKAYDSIGKSIAETLANLTKFPCRAYIDVVYRDPAGTRYYIKGNTGVSEADQHKQYLTLGYEPENVVLNIMKAS